MTEQDPLDYVEYTTVQETDLGRPWSKLWTFTGPLAFLSIWKVLNPSAPMSTTMTSLMVFMILGYLFVGTIEKLQSRIPPRV